MRLARKGLCNAHYLKKKHMTPDQKYEKGYSDGNHGLAVQAALMQDKDYLAGYEDGKGDFEAGAKASGTASPFIGADVEDYQEPPAGYYFLNEYRTPDKGEVYLTKNGNAGVAKDYPKNNRMRHMLAAIDSCPTTFCDFAKDHSGKHSHELLK